MELINYLEELKNKYQISDDQYRLNITKFLIENNWFGMKPELVDNQVIVESNVMFESRLNEFCETYDFDFNTKYSLLLNKFNNVFPRTKSILDSFVTEDNKYFSNFNEENIFYITNYLLEGLVDEITELNDKEVKYLIETSMDYLNTYNVRLLGKYLAFTKRHFKTLYVGDYVLEEEKMENNDAYEMDEYSRILYYIFNEEYIADKNMYSLACDSKNYIDTWLFISLHFVCDLRNTDLQRIPNPTLPYDPETVLSKIRDNAFTKEDAVKTYYSVIWYMQFKADKPNKTKNHNVDSVKFSAFASVEEHLGKLFAIAEAHYELTKSEGPLIRKITSYKDISRNMGEEIGDLFLYSNFHTRKANKSYMQMIEVMTDSILGMQEDFHVKGYMLASIARSHKGTYGGFASTTIKYLQDQKMTGYSPEFVAKEMFERGVLSYIPKMLLSIITDREIDKLDVKTQTKIINEFNLSARETELISSITSKSERTSREIVEQIYKSDDRKETITRILHRIGNGEAVSKNEGTLCLMSSLGINCPYSSNNNCSVCKYEISTKSTLINMTHEFYRLKKEFKEIDDELSKNKLKAAAMVVAKSMDEMFKCYEDMYGKEDAEMMKKILRELNEEN